MTTPLTEQQLTEYEQLIARTTPHGAAVASPGMAAALAAEIRRLRAQLATPRALALLEAADFLRDVHFRDGLSVQEIGAALRHMVDEADPMVGSFARDGFGPDEIADMLSRPAAPDSLPAWLHGRFAPEATAWEYLDDVDRAYWEHEAAAVRRAVARRGFKTPDATPSDAAQALINYAAGHRTVTADSLTPYIDALTAEVRAEGATEIRRLWAALTEMTHCRDNAMRALYRDDVETDIDLEETIAAPFYGPGWDWDPSSLKPVVREAADAVRPAFGKLTQQRDRARRIAVALEQETARLEDELAEEKASNDPRLRCLIVKPEPGKDMYVGWSNSCEMPAGVWSRETALEYGFPRSRLDRADENGSSSFIGDGARDDKGWVAEQRGWLRRDRIGEYAVEYLHGDREAAYALLEPFEDETNTSTP